MAYTAPRTWVTGELVTAALLNTHLRDNLNAAFPLGVDAWTGYTPTLTQSATVTKTLPYCSYQRIGRLIIAQGDLRPSSSGTAGTAVTVGLPVASAAASASTFLSIGSGMIYDASAATLYTGEWCLSTTTTITMLLDQASSSAWGQVPSVAIASGDVIRFHVMYEAAT